MRPTHRCVAATRLAEIEAHLAAWRALLPRALEDNFYLSPAFVCATLRYLGGDSRHVVVFVYRAERNQERLVAVAPFSLRRPTLKRPMTMLCGLTSPHGYLSHPLVDSHHAAGALRALWRWLERPEHPWRLIYFHGIDAASPFLPALEKMLREREARFLSKRMFLRPMLERCASFDDYLASLPAARRKNYRRRWRQLEKAGAVEVVLHRGPGHDADLAERFMQLESRGWKGMHGTALACTQADAAFFRDIVKDCAGSGGLFFVEIKLNGRAIAMTTNFVCGRTLFAFKTAYDPDYRDFSPGILAEVETVRLFHETPELARGEGGATGASYLRSYWRDLTEMRAFYIATPHVLPRMYLSLLSAFWRARGKWWGYAVPAPPFFCVNLSLDYLSFLNEACFASCRLS